MLSRPPFWQFSGAALGIGIFLKNTYPQQFPASPWKISIVLIVLEYTIWLTYDLFLYPRYFSPIRHLPQPPNSHWLLGQTKRIMNDPSGYPQCEWIETVPNDGLIRYTVRGSERIFPTTPKALGEILVTKNYDFVKPARLRNALGRTLGIGILLAEGEEHKIQRKNLMPAFTFRHVKDLYPIFWKKSQELVRCLEIQSSSTSSPSEKDVGRVQKVDNDEPAHAPGTVDVRDFCSRATLDIIGASGMGQDFDSLQKPDNRLNETYRKIFSPSNAAKWLHLASLVLPDWIITRLPVQHNDNINHAAEVIKQTCRDLIEQKRKQLKDSEKTGVDIISVALESGGFEDEGLVNQMMTFLAAGHETTATAMIWAIFYLCRNRDVQQKLRDEIRKSIPSLDSEITAADIDGCHYLHAVCAEVLRRQSPVPLTLRVAACDTSIVGHFIPKGTTVIICQYAINTSKALWGDDAKEFKPERWLDSEGRFARKGSSDSNYSFLTFLHGPRSCIGQKFAEAEFACLLAAWVGTFDNNFEEGSPLVSGEPEVQGGITTKPKDHLWARLSKVDGW